MLPMIPKLTSCEQFNGTWHVKTFNDSSANDLNPLEVNQSRYFFRSTLDGTSGIKHVLQGYIAGNFAEILVTRSSPTCTTKLYGLSMSLGIN